MIDEKQLQEWERLANEATQGPWCLVEPEGLPNFMALRPEATKDVPETGFAAFVKGMDNDDANYAFIAASREAVPALIAELMQARRECDWLAEQCVKFGDKTPRESAEYWLKAAGRETRKGMNND